jgi:hypothetical protein
VAGTVLTLNPIGGIIGGMIGAGAGAGVNEVKKEIAMKRTKADHAFAHLKSFQVKEKDKEKEKENTRIENIQFACLYPAVALKHKERISPPFGAPGEYRR